jgi:hypothetical protein
MEMKMSRYEYNPRVTNYNFEKCNEITLLDLFAAASLQGLRAAGAEGSILDVSDAAYQDAKTMLDERQRVLAEIEGK